MELLKNDIVECDVTDVGIKGEGITHIEGKTVFIPGALVGERVRAKIIFLRKGFADGLLLSVLKPSPLRVKPPCPYFGKCGGCTLQHISREGEGEIKRNLIINAFKSVAGTEVAPAPTVMGERYGYRNKCSFPIRAGGDGTAKIGFFAQASHRVVETEDCLLQKGGCRELIAAVKEFALKVPPYDEESNKGTLRHVVVRDIGGRAYVTVVTTARTNLKELERRIEKIYPSYSLWQNVNPKRTNVIFGEKFFFEGGDGSPTAVDGVIMDVHPAGFFQVNDEIRGKLSEAITAALGESYDTIVDAYSGAGFFTAGLAKKAKRVIGVELNREASLSAKKTAELNRIDNMESICGDCAEVLPKLSDLGKTAVVLDPPRAGCDEKVLSAAAALADEIVYISCYPPTLARDTKLLLEKGFILESVTPYDMFPCTVSVETLCVFRKKR